MGGSSFPSLDMTQKPRIKNLFVFGDSYSSIGYDARFCPAPCHECPMGVVWPGDCETEKLKWGAQGDYPNWVGHLLKMKGRAFDKDLRIHDYAVGGSTIAQIWPQIDIGFVNNDLPRCKDWTAENSLFAIFVGVNDNAFTQDEAASAEQARSIIQLQEKLYSKGARRFLLFNCPPRMRELAEPEHYLALRRRIASWNKNLPNIASQRSDCRQTLVPTYALFERVYDNPEAYGFTKEDVTAWKGGLWCDGLHPTSKFHAVIAKEVMDMLGLE